MSGGKILVFDGGLSERVRIIDHTRTGILSSSASRLRVTRTPYTDAGGRLVVTIGDEDDTTGLIVSPKTRHLEVPMLEEPLPGPRRLSPDHDKRRARAKAARKARRRQRR